MPRWLVWLVALLLLALVPAPVQAQDPCEPGNLVGNCTFGSFAGSPPNQVPSGWTPFVLSGGLTFRPHDDTFFGAPSLMMWSNGGTFTAGIFTQVGGLTPGASYVASMGWGAPNSPSTFGRRLGIDPTGGTDPGAGTVVWGPLHYGPGAIMNKSGPYSPDNANLSVSAVAQGDTVTVFVWVEHPRSTGDNYIFIDNVGLRLDPSQPIVAPTPPPTPTPLPTATQPPPTATPTVLPTDTATATATHTASPSPTASPTATATPTQTPTPTATASPTATPTTTPTRPPRPTATPPPLWMQVGRTTQQQPSLLLYAGFVSLVGAASIGGLIWRNLNRK